MEAEEVSDFVWGQAGDVRNDAVISVVVGRGGAAARLVGGAVAGFEREAGRGFCVGAGWKDEDGRGDLADGCRPLFGPMALGECCWFRIHKEGSRGGEEVHDAALPFPKFYEVKAVYI